MVLEVYVQLLLLLFDHVLLDHKPTNVELLDIVSDGVPTSDDDDSVHLLGKVRVRKSVVRLYLFCQKAVLEFPILSFLLQLEERRNQ